MSAAAPLQTLAAKTKPLSTSTHAGLLLQRKCACGSPTASLTGECSECKSKKGLQAKLAIGASNDPLEREADRVADQVLAKSAHPEVSNSPLRIQRFVAQPSAPTSAEPASVDRALASPGKSLEPTLRQDMEQRFGHDFSQVRVHSGELAEQSALDVDARAYTVGQHIVFSAGRYAPGTSDGMRLIAHELTHVVQQSGAGAGCWSPSGVLQRKPRSDASPAQPDVDLVPLQGSEGALSEADTAQAGAPEAAPVPQPDSAESLGSPPRTDTSVPAAQSPGPQAPPAELDPGAPVSEALDAATDAGTPANAIQAAPVPAAPAADDSSMPRLTDLLLPARNAMAAAQMPRTTDAASPSGISDSANFTAATPDDLKMFVSALRAASGDARKQVADYAAGARASLGQRSEIANGRVAAEVKRADEIVRTMIAKRRSNLELTLRATESSVEWQKDLRQKEADPHGLDGKLEMAATVRKERGRAEKAIARWAGYIGTLRDFHIKRVKDAVAENAFQAVHKAELYDKRIIGAQSRGPERAAVQREATSTLAKALADEFRKAEPTTIAEITKSTAEMAGVVYEYGDKFFAEFDKMLPQLLNGIDEQVAAAKEDIAGKARDARAKLAKAAREMHARLDFLEKEGLARNAAIGAAVTQKIESSRTEADRQYQRAVAQVMQPIGGVVGEAVGILTAEETLDLDAAWQFVGEIIGFARGAAEESGQLFLETRAGVVEALDRPAPVARHAMAGVRKELAGILRDEGVEAELKLVDFETLVDQHYGASIAVLDETFVACRVEARNSLAPAVNEVRQALETGVMEAAVKLREGVNEALYGQILGLRRLPKELHNAALDAAWRYDHPKLKHVVDAINWVGKAIAVLFVAITIIAALILVFKLAVAGLTLLVGALVAEAIAALVGGFLIGYFGTKAYIEAGKKKDAGHGEAFLAALGEVTGVTQVYRALTDSSLSLEERGVLLGFGALSIFGAALGAARIFKAIKLRFPPRITDPRGAAALRPIAEAPAAMDLPAVEPPVPVKPPTVVRGFAPQSKPVEASVAVDAPVKPPTVVRGFGPQPKVAEAPVPVDAPVTTSPSVGGFGRQSGQRMRVADVQQTTPVDAQMPRARETPGDVASPGGAQGARATAQPPEPAPGMAPTRPGPVKGNVEVLPAAPETAVPKVRPPSRRLGLAEERAAETKQLAEKAGENLTAAAREKAIAERNLDEMKGVDARKPGDREFIDEELARLRSEAKEAGKKLNAARRSQKDAADEAAEVEVARSEMRKLEGAIARIDQKIAKLTRDPELVEQHGYKPDQKPPSGTKWGREYEGHMKQRKDLVDQFEERFDDVTRRIADQVARMTPGEEGKALALENAKKLGETHKVLKPEGDTPIDVTTGKPIEGDYVSDHLMARTEIAKDPRFKLLDRAGRKTMLSGIPENSLPITPIANSSKLNKKVPAWIQDRAKAGKPLDADMAKALRDADRIAREAVEAMFKKLLGDVQ